MLSLDGSQHTANLVVTVHLDSDVVTNHIIRHPIFGIGWSYPKMPPKICDESGEIKLQAVPQSQ